MNRDVPRRVRHVNKKRRVVSDCLDDLQNLVANIGRMSVADVIIGAGYTGVRLSSGQVGLAHSLLSEQIPGCCELTSRAGSLAGSPVLELAKLALSWDTRSRAVGVATLNALSDQSLSSLAREVFTLEGNILDHLAAKDNVVCVVGNIRPTVEKLRNVAKKVYVLERDSDLRDDQTLPDTAAEEIIPESDVVLITGTSIVNGTVDRLLELSQDAREVALVGATAGILPTVLFRHGATAVGTVRVKNAERVMRVIAEGGGTPSFGDAIEFVVHRPLPRASE